MNIIKLHSQSDEESDASAADTETMLRKALYSATNFKRFSEDEDNESENDAKKQVELIALFVFFGICLCFVAYHVLSILSVFVYK